MVERYVFIKLNSEHATAAGRREVIDRTFADLRGVPGLVKLIVGEPADAAAERSWDVSLVAVFDDIADVEPYLAHPDHRRYMDEFLAPRMEILKAWNFDARVEDL